MKSISTLFRQLFLIVVLISAFSLSAWGEEVTVSVTFSNYTAGTQYAKNEKHIINDALTLYTTECHFTTELRIYSSSTHNGYVISNQLPGTITKMTFNAGNKADDLLVYGSTNGSSWEQVGSITTAASYNDYTIDFIGNYTYFKLDVKGSNQVRLKKMSVTYEIGGDEPEPTLAVPTFSVDSKSFTSPFTVTLSCETEGAEIYYNTTTQNGEYSLYENAINISETTTIYAKSKLGETESEVVSKTYTKLNISNTPTIADFLSADVSDDVWYTLTGVVSNITSTTYGNFDLTDETGTIYVYGLTKEKVESNNQSFSSIGIENNDTLTLCGVRAVYNDKAQVGGPAYYISHKKYIAPTYTVTLYNGNTIVNTIETSEIDLPTTGPTPSEACQNAGWEFAGWSTSPITEDATSATLLTGTYTPKEDIKLYAVYKLEENPSTGSAEEWALTEIANISATDEVVITMTYTDGTIYALSSSNGTSSAPTATILTASNNNLSEAPTDDLVWNISKNDDSYTIYPNGTTETWLYCTATNNGVRVGDNTNKTFTIDATSGYLKHTATNRYLGVYRTNPDWRCYTNTTGNTANQTLGFYVKTGGSQTTITYNSNPNCETPIAQIPTFTPEEGKVTDNKFTEPFSLTISSETENATIYYSFDGKIFNKYTEPITISTTTTIYAYAEAEGYDKSNPTKITYTFLKTYTINWYNGDYISTEKYTENTTLNLPQPQYNCSDVYTNFAGWTTNASEYKGIINSKEPQYVSNETIVTSNMDLYAVFNNATTTISLVTDASTLAVGDKIIIAAAKYNYALSTTQNSNNRGQADFQKDGNSINSDIQILTLEAGTKENTFAFNTGSGYLYAASSSSNHLRTETTLSANSSWKITIADGVATVVAQGTNTRNLMKYNSNNNLFSCYSSEQDDIVIYKVEGEPASGWTICGDADASTNIIVENKQYITINKTTNINTLTIKSNPDDEAGEVNVTDGALSANKVIIEKTIDASRWFFFSLPFDCKISDIVATYVNGGAELEYAPDASTGNYVIAEYNGGWAELIGKSHTLNANQGYIIGHFGSGDVTVKFPSNGAQNISAPANETLEKTSDNGFNLIGLPYYQKVNVSLNNVNHLSIPNKDGETYNQTDNLSLLANIAPFTSFFVQTDAENIEFTLGAQQNAAPRLDGRSNRASLHKAVVTLTDANGGADKTTIINNPSKTTDYEIGHDLTKLIGYAEIPQIYSLQGEEMLAFNSLAIDNSTVIPLGVYAHADGDYTFALSEKSVGDLEGWELYDNETGKTTRLANEDLTVNLAQGTHEGRFEIRLQQRITTDCDNAMGDMTTWTANGTLNINNLPADAVVYIYDAVGRMVYVANNNSTTFNYTFAARGVYNIVVRTAENSVSFKTIY